MADVKINLVSADGSFSKVLDKKWIKNIETKSQKSPSPEEIFYGSIENSGTLEVLDVDGSIKKAIDEGTLKNSGVEISVFVNGKQIGKHISKDTDYNSTLNVFRFELGDVLSDLDKLIYTGYDYKTDKSNTTLYDVLFDVFKKFFSIKNKRFDYSQLNLMLGNKNVSGMFLYDYLKGIVVQNAILEKGQSYRSAINKICEIAQLTLATDSKGEVMFFDSRPILPLDKIGKDIVIDKKHLIGVPDKSVFVNNNYNKVVVSPKKIILSKNAVLDSEIINPKGKELLDYYITEEGFEGEENYGTVNNPTDFYNAQSFYVGGYNPLNVWSMVAGKIEQYVSSGSFNIQKTSQMVELSKNNEVSFSLSGKRYRVYQWDYFSLLESRKNIWENNTRQAVIYTSAEIDEKNPFWSFDSKDESGQLTGVSAVVSETSGGDQLAYLSLSYNNNLSVTEFDDYYKVDYSILTGTSKMVVSATPQNSSNDILHQESEFLQANNLTINIYGTKLEIDLSNDEVFGVGENTYSISGNELLQKDTKYDGHPISNVFANNILDDYKNGVSVQNISIVCVDYFNPNGEIAKDFSSGDILNPGDIVSLSSDDTTFWCVTGRNFRKLGVPIIDAELQALVFDIPPGLFNKQNNEFVSWDELVNGGYIKLSEDGKTVTSCDSSRLRGCLKISSDISALSASVFSQCQLEWISVPDSVKTVGRSCFNARALKTLIISAESIGNYANTSSLFGDPVLKELDIKEGVISIGEGSFGNCSLVKDLRFPKTLQTIGIWSFMGIGIYDLTIPENVTSIGNGAFSDCLNLTSLKINSKNITLDYYAFDGCEKLKEITINSEVPPILNTRIDNIFPNSVSIINIPNGTLDTYKNATNWSLWADKFVEG